MKEVNDMDEADVSGAKTTGSSRGLWMSAMKIAAAIGITGGGLLLHFMGATSHRVYLEALRLDPGLFPKATDWNLISGYYVLIERTVVIFSVLRASSLSILGAILGLFAFVFCTRTLGRYVERKFARKTPPGWLKGWRGDLFAGILFSCAVYLAVPFTLLFLMILLVPPAALAEAAGLESARRDLATFKIGCGNASPSSGCLELRKGANSLAHGFLIDSSASHIAIFDVRQQRAREFERAGTEVVGDYPSPLDPAGAPGKN